MHQIIPRSWLPTSQCFLFKIIFRLDVELYCLTTLQCVKLEPQVTASAVTFPWVPRAHTSFHFKDTFLQCAFYFQIFLCKARNPLLLPIHFPQEVFLKSCSERGTVHQCARVHKHASVTSTISCFWDKADHSADIDTFWDAAFLNLFLGLLLINSF